jgi:alkylated DNA repair dioxygenase AlkB
MSADRALPHASRASAIVLDERERESATETDGTALNPIAIDDDEEAHAERPAKKSKSAPPPTPSASLIEDQRAEAQAPTKRADFAALEAHPKLRLLHGTLAATAPPPRQVGLGSFFKKDASSSSFSASASSSSTAREPALPLGIVLLRSFLSLTECHALIATADAVSAVRPFEVPEVKNPFTGGNAFSNLYQTYAGQVWNGRATPKGYVLRPRVADAEGVVRDTPAVPPLFLDTVRRAQEAALAAHPAAFERLPFEAGADAFTAIMNYYPRAWGELSVHADTGEPCLRATPRRLYPVVSLSIGDAANFTVYPREDGEGLGPALDIELRSGDVLLFGGASRLIKHKVAAPLPLAARPPGLKMVPGRLNITLRGL